MISSNYNNKIVDEFNLKEIDAFTVEAISKKKIPQFRIKDACSQRNMHF